MFHILAITSNCKDMFFAGFNYMIPQNKLLENEEVNYWIKNHLLHHQREFLS